MNGILDRVARGASSWPVQSVPAHESTGVLCLAAGPEARRYGRGKALIDVELAERVCGELEKWPQFPRL